MYQSPSFYKKGFSLVEAVVTIFITTACMLATWEVYNFYLRLSISNPSYFQASFLAEEGIEAVKFMRDDGWTKNIRGFVNGTPYTFTWNGSTWATSTTVSMIDGKFDRRIVFSEVFRDVSDNISPSGTLDTNTRKVVVSVSWYKDSATTTRQITTYVTNLFNN